MKEQIKLGKKEIKAGINRWKRLVNNKENQQIIDYFEAGNTFNYLKPDYADGCTDLHHYPAIHNDQLYFFVIPKEYDTPGYANNYHLYVECCPVFYQGLGDDHEILPEVATSRMQRWNTTHTTWIPKQNAKPDGVFLAFNMAYSDIKTPHGIISLGLTAEAEPDRADLIVTNYTKQGIVYEDYTMPVPPYGPSASAASFYLLSI